MSVTTDASELGYRRQLEKDFKINETDPGDIRPIEYFSKNYKAAQKITVPWKKKCLPL